MFAYRIGCAGWSVPKADQAAFPTAGTLLQRYAARFSAVEINSTFYHLHRPATYEKWAASVPADFRFAVKHFGGIDIVVNNAGATKRGVFLELTDEDWADGFALKFFGAVRLTRAAWPHLKASRGSVVNISGGGGRTPGAEFAIGGSVNAAMQSFTKAMAEVGIADGVQVNVINPGLIRTGRFQKRLEAVAAEQGVDLATAERGMIAASKTTRVGEPEDIAALVAFIAGPEGRFLQGAMIDMDGGSTKTL